MLSSISMRLPQRHICPWLLKDDCRVTRIILSQSQSAKMIFGFLPPSSSDSFLTHRCRCSGNLSARSCAARKRNSFNIRMCYDRRPTTGPCTMKYIQHTGRQPRFLADDAEQVPRHWRYLAGLGNHAITRSKSRRYLPGKKDITAGSTEICSPLHLSAGEAYS